MWALFNENKRPTQTSIQFKSIITLTMNHYWLCAVIFCGLIVLSCHGGHGCKLHSCGCNDAVCDTIPAGFESMKDCGGAWAQYRVWADIQDSVCGFKVRAMMRAWIMHDELNATTYFQFSRQGEEYNLKTKTVSLLPYDDFCTFVDRNRRCHNDTIIHFDYNLKIAQKGRVVLSDYPFLIMDVDFDGKDEFLIRDKYEYNVYSFKDSLHCLIDDPYRMISAVDYSRKQLIGPQEEFFHDEYVLFVDHIYSLAKDKRHFTYSTDTIKVLKPWLADR